MIFRKTEKKDIAGILEIIESAKERMKNMGLDQWQNGYPNENSIMEDVDKGIRKWANIGNVSSYI